SQRRQDGGAARDDAATLSVGDTWNASIQNADAMGQPRLKLPVPPGWESQNVTNKPYLAVDPGGRVIASFPEQNRLVVFAPDGSQVKELPLPSGGQPVGGAIAPDGKVLTADARAGVVYALPVQ